MSPKNSLPPAAGVPSGNGKYIAIGGLLLAIVAGVIIYLKACNKPPETVAVVTPSASLSVPPPRNTRDDDIPPPPVVPDAGADAGGKTTVTYHAGNPCEAKCTGSTTPDLEMALAQRAQQSKRKCYYPALTTDTTLKGRATISVKIGSNGSACGASVTSNELANPSVAECTANYYRAGGFPAPKGGCVTANVPINYVPGT
jgi:hypothetical protein